jgi:hypothetical protein
MESFFSWRWCGSSTQAWMPTYVSILRIPQMIWVWSATVEWYWQGKTEELGEKPVPVPLCPPQIPHGLTRARSRASAVRGRRLTTWAMARPGEFLSLTKTILFGRNKTWRDVQVCLRPLYSRHRYTVLLKTDSILVQTRRSSVIADKVQTIAYNRLNRNLTCGVYHLSTRHSHHTCICICCNLYTYTAVSMVRFKSIDVSCRPRK